MSVFWPPAASRRILPVDVDAVEVALPQEVNRRVDKVASGGAGQRHVTERRTSGAPAANGKQDLQFWVPFFVFVYF